MFTRLAYKLGLSRASGAFVLEGRSVVRVVRGAAVADDKDVLGRRVFEALSGLRDDPAVWFQRGEPRSDVRRSFSLVSWARSQHHEPFQGAQAVRIVPELAPPLEVLDETDRALVVAARCARTARELSSLVRAPRYRVASLLGFLEAMGALDTSAPLPGRARVLTPAPAPEPAARSAGSGLVPTHVAALALLGLAPGAEWSEVRRAFRALARRLHPDLHAGLASDRRRELELRLAKINAAYAALAPL